MLTAETLLIAPQSQREEIYGIIPNAHDGLEDIKSAWTSRTIHSYQVIPSLENLEDSLWRSAKTGMLSKWHLRMLSNTTKKTNPVVEDYVCMDILPIVSQQRLALEQISSYRSQIFAAHKNLNKDKFNPDKLISTVAHLITEVTCFPGHDFQMSSIKDIWELMNDFISVVGEVDVLENFIAIFKLARFKELNNLIQASGWIDNSLQIEEIYRLELFRFEYESFTEYCRAVKINNGKRRVKIGRIIQECQSQAMPLPNNAGQAHTLAEIPTDSRWQVWDAVLGSGEKISSKAIQQVHNKLINRVPSPTNHDCLQLIQEIEQLLAQNPSLKVSDAVMTFLRSHKAKNFGELEFRMLQSCKRYLQGILKQR